MAETTYVKPARGRTVRYPAYHVKAHREIPPEGARVLLDSYFQRRINAGDLHVVADPSELAPKAKAATAPAETMQASPAQTFDTPTPKKRGRPKKNAD